MYKDKTFKEKCKKQLIALFKLAYTRDVEGVAYVTSWEPVSADPYMEMPFEDEIDVVYTVDIDADFLQEEVDTFLQELISDKVIDACDSLTMSSFLVTDFENAVWDMASYCTITVDKPVEFDKYVVLQDLLRLE